MPAQQWLLESVGIDPDEDAPVRPVVRSQADRWETNLTAARQFHTREGHLHVPRKHVEIVSTGDEEGSQASVRLGAWLDNTRRRATNLTPRHRADLSALGMRW
ncbi:helicase associated domain-containing protein [Streptomyces sp. NPDC001286]